MRLKNVKGASEKIASSNYVLEETSLIPGELSQIFGNRQPIDLEIGMGKGQFLITMALANPDRNYLGIEMYDSVLVRAVEKLENMEQTLPNIKLLRIDGTKMDELIKAEIDTIYLNFSDPWPKQRHAKRRLTSPIFLEKYAKISKGNTHIIMKTDNRPLFEYSLLTLNESLFHFEQLSLDYHRGDTTGNIMTEYEEKFVSLGYPIYRIEVTSRQ